MKLLLHVQHRMNLQRKLVIYHTKYVFIHNNRKHTNLETKVQIVYPLKTNDSAFTWTRDVKDDLLLWCLWIYEPYILLIDHNILDYLSGLIDKTSALWNIIPISR